MPRKKPAPEDYRVQYLHVRVSEKEKARIAYRASLRCMGISEYLRQLGIHGSLPSLEERRQADLALEGQEQTQEQEEKQEKEQVQEQPEQKQEEQEERTMYFTKDDTGSAVEAYETIEEALEKAYDADDKEPMPDDEISFIVAETDSKTVFYISKTLGHGLNCYVKDLKNWEDWYKSHWIEDAWER